MTGSQAEAALRAALRALGTKPKRKGKKEPRPKGPSITITVNGRPADNIGPNVIISVTTPTISRFEAELAAMKEANAQRLQLCVITKIERTA